MCRSERAQMMSDPERIDRAGRRARDSDRERAFDTLRDAAGEGQLDVDELEQRLETAAMARTHGELRSLTQDLTPPRRRSRRPRRLRGESLVFAQVMLGLVVLWALWGGGYFWPLWPMLGWGTPLALRLRTTARGRRRALPGVRPGS